MDDTTDPLADEALPRARLALLLEHFSRLDDEREVLAGDVSAVRGAAASDLRHHRVVRRF